MNILTEKDKAIADNYFWGNNGKKKDMVKAKHYYDITAKKGNLDSMNKLKYLYLRNWSPKRS